MYRIDSIHDAAMDAFLRAREENRVERWMAAFAWWFYRQHIGNAQDYWSAIAGKLTAELPEADRLAILEQLGKAEDAFVSSAGDWPEMPENLLAYVARLNPSPEAPDLTALRDDAVRKVNREAEAYRLQFITAGDGQVMAYQQKLAEARAAIADGDIAEAAIPHIVAEAAIDGMTKTEKAEQIVATFEAWQAVSAAIEAKRLGAKKAIAAAETVAAISSAASVDWEGAGE